jgi:hypothetical protein
MKSLTELLNESLVIEAIEGDYTKIVLSAPKGEYINLPQGVSNDDSTVEDFRILNREIFDNITGVINKLTKMECVEDNDTQYSTIRTWEFAGSIDNKLLNKVVSAYKKAYKTIQFPDGVKHDISKVRPSMFINLNKEVVNGKYINGFVWLKFE